MILSVLSGSASVAMRRGMVKKRRWEKVAFFWRIAKSGLHKKSLVKGNECVLLLLEIKRV